MSNARYVVASVMAITLTACGSARSLGVPDQSGAASGNRRPLRPAPRTGRDRRMRSGRRRSPAPGRARRRSTRRLLEQAARSSEDTDLPVGAGDLLEISVFEVEELSKIRLRVPSRGVISLPLIGQIQAAGRTTAELEDEIRTRLQRKFMHDPQVSVFLQEHNSQRISVIGAVRKGGVFNLNRPTPPGRRPRPRGRPDRRGGPPRVRDPPRADRRGHRGGGRRSRREPTGTARRTGDATAEVMAPIDLSELADGREDLNIALRSGDVVHVPRAGSVYVGGSVERPGSFLLRGKTTVQQAILAAGGVKDVADWSDVRLYRKTAVRGSGGHHLRHRSIRAGQAGARAAAQRRGGRREACRQGLLLRIPRFLQRRPRRGEGNMSDPTDPALTNGRDLPAPLSPTRLEADSAASGKARRTSGTTGRCSPGAGGPWPWCSSAPSSPRSSGA